MLPAPRLYACVSQDRFDNNLRIRHNAREPIGLELVNKAALAQVSDPNNTCKPFWQVRAQNYNAQPSTEENNTRNAVSRDDR